MPNDFQHSAAAGDTSQRGVVGRPVTVIIVGAGQRGKAYANYALEHPDEVTITHVCEPRPYRLKSMAEDHKVPEENRYTDWRELVRKAEQGSEGKIADAVVVGVLDQEHADVVRAFAPGGYAILCEKPIATSINECLDIIHTIQRHGNIFGTGHVLRYSPYNTAIKEVIDTGVLGEIVNIQHIEPVGNQHFAHSFVRGNWRKQSETTFSLLAKCCHDFDILNFYRSDSVQPRVISSFGSLKHFRKESKPAAAGSATACLDCSYEAECPYSAKKIYVDSQKNTVGDRWAVHIVDAVPDIENTMEAIKPGTRWGQCVYESENDVNDNQVVNLQYEDGTTASLTMAAHTLTVCERYTRITGSHGEIIGNMETFTVTDFRDRTTKTYKPSLEGGSHGGGDKGLMRAFVAAVAKGDQMQLGVTPEDILRSHLMVFAAEKARLEDTVVKYEAFAKEVQA